MCNCSPAHLDSLIEHTEIVPAVNQVELHPYFSQQNVRDADSARGIITQSWSPIGGVYVYQPNDPDNVRSVLQDETVAAIAAQHGKTPAQVVLRWQLQHGLSPIPKSVKADRIAENFDVFDFELTPEQVARIDRLDTGQRGGPDPEAVDTALFPFAIHNS